MDRERAPSPPADAACQAEETTTIFRLISLPSVTPEKTKKPRWDEGGESEPGAKEEGIGEEAEADEDNDCVKDEDDSEDEECSERATRNSVMGFGMHARLTYREVMTDHYNYVIWAKAQGAATGGLRNFLEWVESPDGESFPERITFGMHNGKSFQKVAVEDPSYHRRYKAKNPKCHKLDDYIRYFNRHGNQRAANEGEMATIAFHAGIYHDDGDYGEEDYYGDGDYGEEEEDYDDNYMPPPSECDNEQDDEEDDASEENDDEEDEAESSEEEKEERTTFGNDDDDDESETSEEEEEDEDDDEETDQKAAKKTRTEDEEAAHLAKALMSKKAARLYGRMQHGIAQKQTKVDNLHKKRREIESTREKSKDGKTVLKQKVERLKKERRDKEDKYAETGGSMKKKRRN